jgi:hypothetical protein
MKIIKYKDIEIKVYQLTTEKANIIKNDFILKNITVDDNNEAYFDASYLDICKFMIPLMTNLDISSDKSIEEIKRHIKSKDNEFFDLLNTMNSLVKIVMLKMNESGEQ